MFKILSYHYCSDEELGFEQGPNTEIYPIFPESIPEVKIYKKKLKCVSPEDRIIYGDYQSARA